MVTGTWLEPTQDLAPVMAVRMAVFVKEQGFSAENERDALDEISKHVLIRVHEAPAATGRLYWQDGAFHIGRICVLGRYRGQGLGDLLMRMMLFKARAHGARRVVLGAQVSAMAFYARFGFEPFGLPYDEEGVPHQMMQVAGAKISLGGNCAGACQGC